MRATSREIGVLAAAAVWVDWVVALDELPVQ